MRTLLLLAAALLTCASTFAQDKSIAQTNNLSLDVFTIQLSEFRTSEKIDDHLSSDAVLAQLDQLRKNNKVELLESIRIAITDQGESTLQLGKNVRVLTGVTAGVRAGGGRGGAVVNQNLTPVDVGTLVAASLERKGDLLALGINYSSSHVDELPVDDHIPDIEQKQFRTKLLMKLNEPKLAAMVHSKSTSIFVITIKK